MYTLTDYYHDDIPDDLEYWDYEEYYKQIEQCYEEYELQKDIDALIDERSWQESLRYITIRRIAREAAEKNISHILILKFLMSMKFSLMNVFGFGWSITTINSRSSKDDLDYRNQSQ